MQTPESISFWNWVAPQAKISRPAAQNLIFFKFTSNASLICNYTGYR